MNSDDDLQSISVASSSSSRKPKRNNRTRFLSARSEADELRAQINEQAAEINNLQRRNDLLTYQLAEARSGVSTLIRHLPGEQAPAPVLQPRPVSPRPATPPPAPPLAFIVPDLPDPPILPDPSSRHIVASASVPPLRHASSAPRSILERLGRHPARTGILLLNPFRSRSPSPSERRSRPRRSSPPAPGPPEPSPLCFTQGAASRRPPYRR